MAANLVSSSLSSVITYFNSPSRRGNSFLQPTDVHRYRYLHRENDKVKFLHMPLGDQKSREEFRKAPFLPRATSEEQFQHIEHTLVDKETVSHQIDSEAQDGTSSSVHFKRYNGKPGFVSFYNPLSKAEDVVVASEVQSKRGRVLWFIGPAVLVASFIFPPIYLRRIISAVFEDSLLTDFLILFFTEALFYCGVAAFLLMIDCLRRSPRKNSDANDYRTGPSQLGQRISSVATLVLSLVISMVTMGFVWPWTGPAASATLAPYLVGIVVQFAFEQLARYRNSPSWPAIPIIFQVYRLHQLNRAAQLVTALSFTVKGAEATAHNLAIKKSLGTLLNVLQVLGVICIWSISSFLVWFPPSTNQPES
ncbi:PREDICTED: uncharacterized protein LOC104821479 isoform X2 [Tarenaya hassleriana]|uniref:uncharacterized protein LOC104821479 isoform X2 n=1 Tax=Tarenaya hassleriana TaxID=28532 RepID=UPI00053C5639|nr:PREDICTED: uncharacterized protein LOC104821479 isoform X2 [Tarenaya hassleriana]